MPSQASQTIAVRNRAAAAVAEVERLPFLTAGGTLVIPFDSPERYHWWKPPHDERLRVKRSIAEVKAR